MTGKERMLRAYRGAWSDRIAIAPEFWYYYPAKLLGVDMIEFERDVPFHLALKTAFSTFDCEGWGTVFPHCPNPCVTRASRDRWLDHDTLVEQSVTHTSAGDLTTAQRFSRQEPSWVIERPVKDLARDLPAWELATFGGEPEAIAVDGLLRARDEAGDGYLLEVGLGVPFTDWFAGARAGGLETAIYDFLTPELQPKLLALQARYTDRLVRMARTLCTQTPFESLFIGCSWSCNSLIGPDLWRSWDRF
jgi:hypothetical protein